MVDVCTNSAVVVHVLEKTTRTTKRGQAEIIKRCMHMGTASYEISVEICLLCAIISSKKRILCKCKARGAKNTKSVIRDYQN